MKKQWNSLHALALALALALLSTGPAWGQGAHQQYWFGDAAGVAFYPTGKNLAYTTEDKRINPVLAKHSKKYGSRRLQGG
jgi:hypothetical protein